MIQVGNFYSIIFHHFFQFCLQNHFWITKGLKASQKIYIGSTQRFIIVSSQGFLNLYVSGGNDIYYFMVLVTQVY